MLKSDKLILDEVLNNSEFIKTAIRRMAKFYKITNRNKIISIVQSAKSESNAKSELEFFKYLKKEFRRDSEKSCGAYEYLDAVQSDKDADEDDTDEVSIFTVQNFLKGSEDWREEVLSELNPKIKRLLDVAEGGTSTLEMAKKLGMTQIGVQKALARQTAKLGGHSHEKKALPRADFKPLSREEKLKAEVHPCISWTAEQIAELNAGSEACHA